MLQNPAFWAYPGRQISASNSRFFLLKFLLDKSQGTQKFWIKRCKNMQSGHFLAHKPAFLNLLFNKDNFDFWFDS
jgi:hypothetical protein